MNRADVAYAFTHRERARTLNLITNGDTIWSYGDHWPIAKHLDAQTVALNVANWASVTTKCQTTAVRYALMQAGYADTGEDGCELERFPARVFARA